MYILRRNAEVPLPEILLHANMIITCLETRRKPSKLPLQWCDASGFDANYMQIIPMITHNQLYIFFRLYVCKSKLTAISVSDSCQKKIKLNITLTRQEFAHFETGNSTTCCLRSLCQVLPHYIEDFQGKDLIFRTVTKVPVLATKRILVFSSARKNCFI